jgi:outer membrane protein assembly factor BamB
MRGFARAPLAAEVVAAGVVAAGVVAVALGVTGCSIPAGVLGYESFMDAPMGARPTGRLSFRWTRRLAVELEGIDGRFLPIERAVAAMDAAHDRIYVGSSRGYFWSLTGSGAQVYMYQAAGAVGCQPLLDTEADELYFASDDGVVHALVASTGELRWRAEIDGAVGRRPIATDDVVFVVTDGDVVVAYARDSGEALWRYRRDAPEGFYIAEHAGLVLAGRSLITGFTDGAVIALDSRDGHVQWTRETLEDLPATVSTDAMRFTDVDTTPVIVDGVAYIASFAGGLYALEVGSGSVRWLRRELTGLVGLALAPSGMLIGSSGDLGVVGIDRETGDTLWTAEVERGAPTAPTVVGDLVIVGETEGGLVSLLAANGNEVGRLENGHGFAAPVAIDEGLGAVVSNAGALFVFNVR